MNSLTEKISKKIVHWVMCHESEISKEQEEILVYGYVLFLESFYKTIIMLLIAIITHTFWRTLITIGSFGLLRSFAGGIHCRSGIGCTFCMVIVWMIGLLVSWIEIPLPVLIVMICVVLITIILYAPKSTKNNPIRSNKIKKQKHFASIAVVLTGLSVGFITGVYMGQLKVLNMILTSFLIEAFSILLLVEKEGEENEEQKPEGIGC